MVFTIQKKRQMLSDVFVLRKEYQQVFQGRLEIKDHGRKTYGSQCCQAHPKKDETYGGANPPLGKINRTKMIKKVIHVQI